MAMADSALQTRLAENIALLGFLGNVPVRPSRNHDRHEEAVLSAGRTLPVQTERELTRILAFLSSHKEDINNVTAVCVRESESSLCVLVAANSRGPGLSPYLDSVKAGFESIFTLLRKASTSKSF